MRKLLAAKQRQPLAARLQRREETLHHQLREVQPLQKVQQRRQPHLFGRDPHHRQEDSDPHLDVEHPHIVAEVPLAEGGQGGGPLQEEIGEMMEVTDLEGRPEEEAAETLHAVVARAAVAWMMVFAAAVEETPEVGKVDEVLVVMAAEMLDEAVAEKKDAGWMHPLQGDGAGSLEKELQKSPEEAANLDEGVQQERRNLRKDLHLPKQLDNVGQPLPHLSHPLPQLDRDLHEE